jgi:hypothetical protein
VEHCTFGHCHPFLIVDVTRVESTTEVANVNRFVKGCSNGKTFKALLMAMPELVELLNKKHTRMLIDDISH